jgi:hypothetical protein
MAFDIHFGKAGSNVVHNVIDNKARIELGMISSIIARIKFDISGERHATEIISIRRRNRSIVNLKNNWREVAGQGGEGRRSA